MNRACQYCRALSGEPHKPDCEEKAVRATGGEWLVGFKSRDKHVEKAEREIERLRAYAEEQRDALRALLEAATDARWPQTAEQMLPMNLARAALAKNPNPAGPFPATEASGTLATEASGAGGAGTDQRGSLPPRFKKGDGSFEDWYEGYFAGCTRPNGTITSMLRHAFEAGGAGLLVQNFGHQVRNEAEESIERRALQSLWHYISWRHCPDADQTHYVSAAQMRLMQQIVRTALDSQSVACTKQEGV